MKTDVRQQVRTLAEFHQESRQPVELHEVQDMVSQATTRKPRRSLPGPAVAMAIMVSVLAVVGGVALIVSTTQGTPPADTLPVTTPPTQPASTLQFTKVPPPADLGGLGENVQLTTAADEFVLCSDESAVTSADGVNWEPVRSLSAAGFWCTDSWGDTIARIVEAEPRTDTVEVIDGSGEVRLHTFQSSVHAIAVNERGILAKTGLGLWFSEDGSVWQEVDDLPTGFHFASILQMIGSHDGFYAIQAGGNINALVDVWYSKDGFEWIDIGTARDGHGDLKRWGDSVVWDSRATHLLTPTQVIHLERLEIEGEAIRATGGTAGQLIISNSPNDLDGHITDLQLITPGGDIQPLVVDPEMLDSYFVAAASLGDTFLVITRSRDRSEFSFWLGDTQ